METIPGLKVGIGVAQGNSAADSFASAAESALLDIGDRESVSHLLFLVSCAYGAEEIEAAVRVARANLPAPLEIGGSTVGGFVVDGDRIDGFLAGARGVLCLALGGAPVIFHFEAQARRDPQRAAARAGDAIRRLLVDASRGSKANGSADNPPTGAQPPGRALLFVPGFSEDAGASSREFAAGLASQFVDGAVSGGGASGGLSPEGVMLPGATFHNGGLSTHGALVIAIGGTHTACGYGNAMDVTRELGVATGVNGARIDQLGGRPAGEAFLACFGPEEQELLRRNPGVGCMELGVALGTMREGRPEVWTVQVNSLHADGSIATLPVGIAEGETVFLARLAKTTSDDVSRSVSDALRRDAPFTRPTLLVTHSCIMRSFHLGEAAEKEWRDIQLSTGARHHVCVLAIGEVASANDRTHHEFTAYSVSSIEWRTP